MLTLARHETLYCTVLVLTLAPSISDYVSLKNKKILQVMSLRRIKGF